MSSIVSLSFSRFMICLNLTFIFITIWGCIFSGETIFNGSFNTVLYYIAAISNLTIWMYLIAILNKYQQTSWIKAAYWVFLFWQILSLLFGRHIFEFIPYSMTLISTIGILAFLVQTYFLVANFNVCIDGFSANFKFLGAALLLGAMIRVLLPFLGILFEVGLLPYNDLTYLLPVLVTLLIFLNC